MNHLNNDLILELKEIHTETESETPLYAVNLGTSFIITDNALIIEWPSESVDRDATQLAKLTRAASNPNSKRRQLLNTDWRQIIESRQLRRVDSIKAIEGYRVIQNYGEDVHYDAYRFLMIYSCIKEPHFRIADGTYVLCINDGKRFCGALAHCLKPLVVDRKQKKALIAEKATVRTERE